MLAAFGFREIREQQRQLDVLKRGEHRDEVVHLEDEADVAGPPLGQLVGGHVRDFVAGDGDAAVRRDIEAAQQIEQGGLARAAGPHEGHEIAFVDVEIQALQHLDLFAAAAVGLVQTANLDEAVWFCHCRPLGPCLRAPDAFA